MKANKGGYVAEADLAFSLPDQIARLRASPLRQVIDSRLAEFRSFAKKSEAEWFSELCFCLLAANAKMRTALAIQQELGMTGVRDYQLEAVRQCIRRHNHRFHNTKAAYIVTARKHRAIKPTVSTLIEQQGAYAAREWLVENIEGFGYKEASHFLRNVGCVDLAILDRHILQVLHEHQIIREKPTTLSKKRYLDIEQKFFALAEKAKMAPGELDLYLWYMKTGEVVK